MSKKIKKKILSLQDGAHSISKRIKDTNHSFLQNLRLNNIYDFIKSIEPKKLMPQIKEFKNGKKEILPQVEKLKHMLYAEGKVAHCEIENYLNYYNIDHHKAEVSLEMVFTGQFNLALYHFIPKAKKSDKKILLVHGYLEHTGNNNKLVNFLIAEGYEIFAIDLPGHGLSTGTRFSIDNFSLYGEAIDSTLQHIGMMDFAIGHSTGCAAIMDYLARFDDQKIKHSILACPLVKTYLFDLSEITYKVSKRMIKELPYLSYKYSNNADYLLFKIFADPHEARKIPLKWFESLTKWNKEVEAWNGKSGVSITVLQGDCDKTVDWRYNLPIIQEKFKGSEIVVYKGADHGLFNETAQLQPKVFSTILELVSK